MGLPCGVGRFRAWAKFTHLARLVGAYCGLYPTAAIATSIFTQLVMDFGALGNIFDESDPEDWEDTSKQPGGGSANLAAESVRSEARCVGIRSDIAVPPGSRLHVRPSQARRLHTAALCAHNFQGLGMPPAARGTSAFVGLLNQCVQQCHGLQTCADVTRHGTWLAVGVAHCLGPHLLGRDLRLHADLSLRAFLQRCHVLPEFAATGPVRYA